MIKNNVKGKLFFLTFFFIAFHSIAQDVPKLRIDPSTAYGGNVSEYFKSIEYIPLETNKESLFGDIMDLVITENGFIINDFDTRSVLFFNNKGKYLHKIPLQARSSKLIHDKQNDQINILYFSPSDPKQLVNDTYTSRGKILGSKNITEERFNHLLTKLFMGNGHYAVSNSNALYEYQKPKDSTIYLLEIYNGDSIIKKIFPMNQIRDSAFSVLEGHINLPNAMENGSFYIVTPLKLELFRVSKDSLEKIYRFVFPANRILAESAYKNKTLEELQKLRSSLYDGKNLITRVQNVFFKNNLMFFTTPPRKSNLLAGSLPEGSRNFIYDTLTHKLISLERINPDATNYYLPFMGSMTTKEGLINANGTFYSTVSSFQMFVAREATKNKNPQYPPVLQEYFKTQNRKSNPVIVKMKLKD